ncbi:HAMP domain-containing sensor histidine kinase [uncultured Enterococcus sp.]|uniref:sensor histidine kinase n=1 Tax=uncultured Enterococcus sp. TaxID=167972 RepID=UPI0025D2BFE5|nr:HAMP domain-containing sensor histidine kinase [uncultured Enterococcus sp.]
MKYLYQQLLAFTAVIVITLLTMGVVFTRMTERTIEKNNYAQLTGYGEAVQRVSESINERYQIDLSKEEIIQNSLATSEMMLNQQSVNFVFINTNHEIIYPLSVKQPSIKISTKVWQALSNGEAQQMTSEYNLFGRKEATSYAMIPFDYDQQFFGVLIVSQPAKNIEDSVKELNTNLLRGVLLSLIVALAISYFFAHFQVNRINRLRKATREVADGNFDIQVPVANRDEFDDLGADFNKMTTSLKESQEEIERQEERRRQFMADASHEMRTPLTTINGLLEGLQYGAISKDQEENALRLMKNETERLIRLVNENLDYEKIRTNQISMVIKKFDATSVLSEIVTQLAPKAHSADNQLLLETKEAVDIYADYDRFRQIVVNIVQNAIQFTTEGNIVLRIYKKDLKTIVEIKDTGIGMSPDQVTNIWDRYYKVDPSRKNKQFGESGLGLPIVQQLMRLHKGEIEVESELGKGSTFRLIFPDTES